LKHGHNKKRQVTKAKEQKMKLKTLITVALGIELKAFLRDSACGYRMNLSETRMTPRVSEYPSHGQH
jgi:hypothetical protein